MMAIPDSIYIFVAGFSTVVSLVATYFQLKSTSSAKKQLDYGTNLNKIDVETLRELPSVSDEQHLQGVGR